MIRLLVLVVLLLIATPGFAHPAWGIVRDSQGNVFFTDTARVWKITPGGEMSIAVPNVHTHELYVDANDNLYGEHLWYEGDATKKWGHRVWCLTRNGTLTDVIPAREGFRTDYSFVRDAAGTMYWADRDRRTTIKKRSPEGNVLIHSAGDFSSVGKMTALPDGTLFLMDTAKLRRISRNGELSTLVSTLSSKRNPPAAIRTLNYHMGIWTDDKSNIYVAVAAEHTVLRVNGQGKVQVAARSTDGWSPSGGMNDPAGNMWLLEYDAANNVRVRCIDREGKVRTFAPRAAN